MPPRIPGLLELENPFPFLSLPPELRNIVYRHAVLPPGGRLAPSAFKQYRILCPSLAILRSCRQIHYEASEVLYREAFLHGDVYEYMPCQSDGSLGILGLSTNRHWGLPPERLMDKGYMDKGYCLSRIPTEVLARFWDIKLEIHVGEWTFPDHASKFQTLLDFVKGLGSAIASNGERRPLSFHLRYELCYSAEFYTDLPELDRGKIYAKLCPTMGTISQAFVGPLERYYSRTSGLCSGLDIGCFHFRHGEDGTVRFGDWSREDDGWLTEADWDEYGFVEGNTVVYVKPEEDEEEDEGAGQGDPQGQEEIAAVDTDDLDDFYD